MACFAAWRRGGWWAAVVLAWSIMSGSASGQAPEVPDAETRLAALSGEEAAPPERTAPPGDLRLYDSLHCDDNYGLKTLFDSLHPQDAKGKHWYEKYALRGYFQPRFGRTLYQAGDGGDPNIVSDRSINGNAEDFFVRRARMIFFGDVSDYMSFYMQYDFAVTLPGVCLLYTSDAADE